MVDVIASHLQEAYVGWRYGSEVVDEHREQITGQRPSTYQLKQFAGANRRRALYDKDSHYQVRDSYLYRIKEIPSKTSVVVGGQRPYAGLCCTRCTPNSRESLVKTVQNRPAVINILNYGREYADQNGLLSKAFRDIIQACRVRRFQYRQVAQTVMNDERLKKAIEQVTQETLHKLEENASEKSNNAYKSMRETTEARAKAIILNMRSTLSDFLLRLTSWTLYKLLPYFISSVSASPTQMEMLKKAGETGLPLIFMPLHRSHLDYILVSFILLNNNIKSPLVAAGDNLKIPLFGWLLRGLGAFYIKRRLEDGSGEKDVLYRAALHTYIMHCLRAHHNIEFYIEGGRSRTGKPLLPKSGILSVIVDAYLDGTIEDALLVPVSMNYDKIVDGNFVSEQTGKPKEMESFSIAIKSIWKILNSHYGNIRIDFNQPFSIQELVRTFQQYPNKLSPIMRRPSYEPFKSAHNNQNDQNGLITIKKLSMERCLSSRQSCSSLYGTDVVIEEQRGLVEAIARHIVYDSTHATSVMSTNAIVHILLTQYRHGCTLKELATALSELKSDLYSHNHDVGFSGEPIDVAQHAINLLGSELIKVEGTGEDAIVRPVLIRPQIIELSYYSYGLSPYYALYSVVITAAQSIINDAIDLSSTIYLRQSDLVDASLQLCEILSQEYILCKPCQQLDSIISDAIDYLSMKEIFIKPLETYTDDQRWSNNFARTLDDDDYHVNREIEYTINNDETSIKYRCKMQTVIRPLIEVYSITTSCLPELLSDNGMKESDFVNCVLSKIREQLDSGECKYGEALSVDAIKNCVRLLRQWGVVEAQAEGKTRILNLTHQYKSYQSVDKIHSLIRRFKTETPKYHNSSKR